jgi:hypothetical protein
MDEKLVNNVEAILKRYLGRDAAADYVINRDLVSEILDIAAEKTKSGKKITGIAVMFYLIIEAFNYHRGVSDLIQDNSLAVIYGDYFCTAYHRSVMDFGEFELNEKIVSAYKKMCIRSFDGEILEPVSLLVRDQCR